MEPLPCLHFAERRLEWAPTAPDEPAPCQRPVACERLRDLIQRAGAIALSPDVVRLMLFPDPEAAQGSDDPLLALSVMDAHASGPDASTARDVLRRLQSRLPPTRTTRFREPHCIVAWRLETPSRAILFTGNPNDVHPSALVPHALPKAVAARTPQQQVSRIQLTDRADDAQVRACLLQYCHAHLPPLAPADPSAPTPHTLEEALVCFTRGQAPHVARVPLAGSRPWTSASVDPRYAETQQAANGMRYRDWLCVYADDQHLEKCKLDSHALAVTELHQTDMLFQHADGSEWVAVRSSLPVAHRLLQAPSRCRRDRLQALASSVKASFLHDLKLLPTRSPAHTVHRQNLTVYTDQPSQQLMVVYAPSGEHSDKLEFISFALT